MSYVQPRGGRETRRPRGGTVGACYDVATNQKTYRPSGEGGERHIDDSHRLAMINYMHGEQKLPLPPRRNWSPGWEEERELPSRRNLSRGWHDERALADSDTLPACWQHELLPAKERTRDINDGQPTGGGARVHFQRPAERRQWTPEDEDEEEEGLGSSPHNSLGGSLTIVEKVDSKPEFRDRALSHSFDIIEDEWAGSGDEDGYVHILQDRPREGTLDRKELSIKART